MPCAPWGAQRPTGFNFSQVAVEQLDTYNASISSRSTDFMRVIRGAPYVGCPVSLQHDSIVYNGESWSLGTNEKYALSDLAILAYRFNRRSQLNTPL